MNILPISLLLKANINFEAALKSDPNSMHYQSTVGHKSTKDNAYFYVFYDYKYFPSAYPYHDGVLQISQEVGYLVSPANSQTFSYFSQHDKCPWMPYSCRSCPQSERFLKTAFYLKHIPAYQNSYIIVFPFSINVILNLQQFV